MRWPWTRPEPKPLPELTEGKAALERAVRRLREAQSRQHEVDAVQHETAQVLRSNHFTEKIERLIGGAS
jgi:hypothetical protein